MADRKAEIDLKRKKLEELRKSREQKRNESANKAVRKYIWLNVECYFPWSQLLTRGTPPSRTKSPDPLSKERDDVNKLVSDLIGGSAIPTQTSVTPSQSKSPAEVSKSPPMQISATAGKRKVKLVMETLAPVVIRPKVGCIVCQSMWYGISILYYRKWRFM